MSATRRLRVVPPPTPGTVVTLSPAPEETRGVPDGCIYVIPYQGCLPDPDLVAAAIDTPCSYCGQYPTEMEFLPSEGRWGVVADHDSLCAMTEIEIINVSSHSDN